MLLLALCLLTVNRFALLTEESYKHGDWDAVEGEAPFMGNLPLEGLKVVDIAVPFASPTISSSVR
ncbi:MAG TPA: hypothetical protein VKK81_24945 [Candidatus Binatia bacterium]|nr:hypothetical protein [Candidatus Binatia bacterium]